MEKTVTVTQRNFKHLREQYGAKLKDIADVCNLSQQTVSNFEKCKGEYTQINARSYNGDMMIAALQNLIDEKLKKHTEGSEDTCVGKRRYNKLTDIPRRVFVERLENYLNTEHITLEEFCKMCELSTAQFEDWYIERNPMLSKQALRHITASTGWTYNDIKSGDFVTTKNNAKGEKSMSYVPTSKSITPEKQDIEQETHKKNTRFICDETGFFIEYDIVQHVKQRIPKDMFIKAINGEV